MSMFTYIWVSTHTRICILFGYATTSDMGVEIELAVSRFDFL